VKREKEEVGGAKKGSQKISVKSGAPDKQWGGGGKQRPWEKGEGQGMENEGKLSKAKVEVLFGGQKSSHRFSLVSVNIADLEEKRQKNIRREGKRKRD